MKNMKKNILAVLCTSFVASLAFSVGAVNVPAANAETETYTVETVQMREGASVRVGEEGEHADKKGIRFSLLVSQEYYATFESPVVGVYVVPASYVENATEMQSETSVPEEALHFYTANVEALGGDIDETANDTYSFNAVIYGIPADEFGTDLIANGYIVEGEGAKVFASNPQTRSIAQVASLALATGDTRDGLTGYVDGVVTEENFKLKDVRMDASQATTPSVVEAFPENLTAIWTSSNEEVVTVNANGELTFTGVAGEATITAKLGTKEATATATYVVEEEPEDTEMPVVLKASEEAVGSVIAIKDGVTHTFEFAEAGTFEFAGEYAGDAMKLAYVSSTDYRIANPYTVEELEAFKEEYTGVTLSFAFDDDAFTAGGQFFFYANNTTFVTLANGGNVFEISANANALRTWYTFTVSIDDYIKTLSEDGTYFRFAEVGRANTEVDGNLYISDVTLTKGEIVKPDGPSEEPEEPVVRLENEVLKVTEKTASDVYLFDGSANRRFSYVDASTLGFAGSYTGGAAKHDWFNNRGYRVATSITAEEVDALKEKGYVDVTLWFAVGGAAHTGDQILFVNQAGTDNKNTFVNIATGIMGYDSFKAGGLQTNKWYKLTISLDQFKSTLSNGYFNLVASWDNAGGGAGRAFYVGDILFAKEEKANVTFPEIITMTEDTANQVWINGGAKFGYVDASTLGFAGDYTGTGAAKVSAAENAYYHFANPYTAEQLEEAKGAGYTSVSLWFAIDGYASFNDGAIWVNSGTTILSKSAPKLDPTGTGYFANVGLQANTWYKFTVSVEEFISVCEGNYVKLAYVNQWNSNFGGRNVYVGNIYFE